MPTWALIHARVRCLTSIARVSIRVYDYIATFLPIYPLSLANKSCSPASLWGNHFLASCDDGIMRRRLNEGIIPGIKPPDGPSDDAED